MRLKPHGRKTDIFSLGLIYTFILFKAYGVQSVIRRLRSDRAWGNCPGMLGQESINVVLRTIVEKLNYPEEEENVSTSCELLLQSMVQVDENDRANVYDVATNLSQFLQNAAPNMQLHCQTENLVEETSDGSDAVEKELECLVVDDEFWSG
jgi:hypothetical protein